jgi:hypothetical protein
MVSQLNSRKTTLIRLSLMCLLASAAVLIVVTIAKRPLAASLPTHGAAQSAQVAARYQDLLRSRDQARRAVPQKISQEVYYSPEVKKNVVTVRYLVPSKGEILVATTDEAVFLKPYQDALDAAEKAIADFQGAEANANSSKE